MSESPDYVVAADEKDLADGTMRGVQVAGQSVVVAKVGASVYAIAGVCTHQHALLADGDLDGEVVTCPLHMSGFNVKTGQVVSPPATKPVATYDVRVEDGKIMVSTKPR